MTISIVIMYGKIRKYTLKHICNGSISSETAWARLVADTVSGFKTSEQSSGSQRQTLGQRNARWRYCRAKWLKWTHLRRVPAHFRLRFGGFPPTLRAL